MSEPVVIRCRENGPYVVQGVIKVFDAQGNEFLLPQGKDTMALCRCGHFEATSVLRWITPELWLSGE